MTDQTEETVSPLNTERLQETDGTGYEIRWLVQSTTETMQFDVYRVTRDGLGDLCVHGYVRDDEVVSFHWNGPTKFESFTELQGAYGLQVFLFVRAFEYLGVEPRSRGGKLVFERHRQAQAAARARAEERARVDVSDVTLASERN